MANFVNLRLGTRGVIINKDFIIKVEFYSHDTEQNVLVITFTHNVEFPFFPESERECKQIKFFFSKSNDTSEIISSHSKLCDFARALNRDEINIIWLEDFFAPQKNQQLNESSKESK